ncbi:MAG: DNA repair protein RecN [Clostridia bacterium]|nr:DNA repair protein RecN [Clostridia bacterium]
MLRKLYIENIAVIERAEIDFSSGFNVLTGETGAGKSILVDSINAVLGQRTSRELIRTGADRAFVSAEFDSLSPSVLGELAELGYEPDAENGGTLLLRREIRSDGKNTVRINDRPASISDLRAMGRLLINIHGQHENQALMSVDRHMKYLDSFGGYGEKLNEYSGIYKAYASAAHELSRMRTDDAEKARRADILRFQINELEQADLSVGETDSLKKRRNAIENAERISGALSGSYSLLNGGDDTDGAISMLQQCCSFLLDISSVCEGSSGLADRISGIVYELEDISSEISSKNGENEFNPSELNDIEARLETLSKISRKYGEEGEALAFLEKARAELDSIERSDELLAELTQKARECYHKALKAAAELTQLRKEAAEKFCEDVGRELTFLDMPSVKLAVDIKPCNLSPRGADSVEFLISANPGEPPKPIGKIASGGELSRIMLAIKTVLAGIDDIDTMIFDEVDTGISGRAAHKVGVKLHEVSGSRQIICITHLAQMAAQADNHLLIKKNVKDGRTFTSVTPLSFEQRKQELARINGGDTVTESMLRTAEEMLNSAGFFG